MIEILQIAVERVQWYIGDGWHHILFLAALIFLVFQKNEKEHKKWLAGFCFLFSAVYIFPLTAGIIMKYCIGTLVYWRMLWLMPTSIVLAYVAVKLWQKPDKTWMKWTVAAVLALLIAVAGQSPYLGEDSVFVEAHNLQKLPTDACQVCDLINADLAEGEKALIAAPDSLNGYIRQYDASIEQAYGRKTKATTYVKRIRRQMRKPLRGKETNFKILIRNARRVGVNYLVYLANEEQDAKILAAGYRKVGTVGDYIVYHDEK